MYKKIKLISIALLMTAALAVGRKMSDDVSSGKVREGKEMYVVLLDSGHGGSDPGKIGVNQSKEKDINLQIAKKVKKELEKEKVKVVMTRTEDKGLDSEGARNHKVEDMKERVRLINETAPDLAVSIHQNSYTGESIKGAQVFYFTHSEEGRKAAEIMQERLRAFDAENRREAKANSTYYVLKKTEPPTIIVECGFLSNHEEAQKLVSEEYQQDMAKVISEGILRILKEQKQESDGAK